MPTITYRIDQFEGPLDLLLSLISKNKINIDDIPISVICDQYMEYIEAAQMMDMDLSSEFILTASRLMLIKSRMLIPKSSGDSEEDPRAELANALIEYQRAKEASKLFAAMYSEFGGRFSKDTDEFSSDKNFVAEHDVSALAAALMRAYSDRNSLKSLDELKSGTDSIKSMISSRAVSVTGKIFSLMRLLRKKGKISASEYFSSAEDKPSLISMFMAVLELLRAQRLIMTYVSEEPDGTVPLNTGKSIIFELNMSFRRSAGTNPDTESDVIYEI